MSSIVSLTTHRRPAIWAGLALIGIFATTGASAARQRGSTTGDWCRQESWGDDRKGFCEVREYTVPAAGATMSIDAAPNGGITVEGAARGDILVRARVVATARTEDEARALASRVQVVATPDRVTADGPAESGGREGWSVSYRLSVPPHTPLSLRSTNGGITIDNVNSRVEFRTVNGGVKLSRMGGDVEGRTSNGGIDVELDGTTWNGGGLDVETSNGGVKLTIPEPYSAHLETGTVNGSININFPINVQGRIGRSFSTDIGGGGPTLRVKTSNGGVKINKK
jgi:putative adhesin